MYVCIFIGNSFFFTFILILLTYTLDKTYVKSLILTKLNESPYVLVSLSYIEVACIGVYRGEAKRP